MDYRIEKDTLGEVKVPADCYYGAQTQRAVDNFSISGRSLPAEMTWAAAVIKKAAAMVNRELGLLDREKAEAIAGAAEQVIEGRLEDNFVVDIYQAGAGTSFNMNVNEVIANLAEESLGGRRGEYRLVHPNDHVNMAQSTNDVVPTAIRLACLKVGASLVEAVTGLAEAFQERAAAFEKIITTGRTHLQDAVPITLGQEFGGWAHTLKKCARRLRTSFNRAGVLGLGGSAAGTGLNTHTEYAGRIVGVLRQLTGFDLSSDPNLFSAFASMDVFVDISSRMKLTAVEIVKITGDLRLLSSGLAEIRLPAVQPSSPGMPGQAIPEIAAMAAFQVTGSDLCVTMAAQAGQLQLNVMMPVIAFNLLESAKILTNSAVALNTGCVSGIEADPERCREQ